MNRSHIENLYRANGLENYNLKTTEDLLKCHGINFKKIDGYNRLDDVNKVVYKKFIVNFYNAYDLEKRVELTPRGIYYVEDIEYLAKENAEDEHFIISGGLVKAIDKNGLKFILHTWNDDAYKHVEYIESETKTYLRFQYEYQGHDEWLHVINGKSWY